MEKQLSPISILPSQTKVDYKEKKITYSCGCWEIVESIENNKDGTITLGDGIEEYYCKEHEMPFIYNDDE